MVQNRCNKRLKHTKRACGIYTLPTAVSQPLSFWGGVFKGGRRPLSRSLDLYTIYLLRYGHMIMLTNDWPHAICVLRKCVVHYNVFGNNAGQSRYITSSMTARYMV